ncbi:MAG: YqaE/Pmp3 family membrane protein [Pirellulaceae bacterium]|nr:YqaE/Pmp3 family membrane protein [Pirellulaceae bacterium]
MTTAVNENKLLKLILAILLPPAAVYMTTGMSGQFWLNVVLTILGFWVVGIIHAMIVVL